MDKNKSKVTGTATFVTEGSGFVNPTSVYKLDPSYHDVEFVAVSHVDPETQKNSLGFRLGQSLDTPETKLIPATPDGEADLETLFGLALTGTDEALEAWGSGSRFDGDLDAAEAFGRIGYEVVA